MDTAVYLFTGFLESGKTSFIKETLKDPNFNDGNHNYLIIQCEEGEEEFECGELPPNISLCSFDSADDLIPERLIARQKRYGADVVIIEYNGMWQLDKLYSSLPESWLVYQEIMIADSATFESYNKNMRSLVVDKLTSAEMVVFNRVDGDTDIQSLHKIVRGVSRKASICYEDTTGNIEFDNIEDPLPYDIEAPVINIADEDFAIFYRDMSEDFGKYKGKCVSFKGIVALEGSLARGQFAVGRHVMTCCQDDIAYLGLVGIGMGSLKLKTRDWVKVTGTLDEQVTPIYKGKGPVLLVSAIERAERPAVEVATF